MPIKYADELSKNIKLLIENEARNHSFKANLSDYLDVKETALNDIHNIMVDVNDDADSVATTKKFLDSLLESTKIVALIEEAFKKFNVSEGGYTNKKEISAAIIKYVQDSVTAGDMDEKRPSGRPW